MIDDSNSGVDMVKHLAEVLFLLDYLAPFLVKNVSQTVQGAVEIPADHSAFVKSEVKFLVFQGIQHICNFASHPS